MIYIGDLYSAAPMCTSCETKPVFKHHSGKQLCRSCFLKYFEKKVRKTIRTYGLIKNGDRVAVAVSGGKDSLTVLDLLASIYKGKRSIDIVAILVNEGIEGYRDQSMEHAKQFCEKRGVPLEIVSYKDKFGFNLDNVVQGRKPCSVCGVLRRNLLNKRARELHVTKLATGHNLDDESQSIMMNQFRRNTETSARLGPMTGIEDQEDFIRRIKPLYFHTEKEVMTYAYLKGIVDEFNECPYNKESYRNQVREMLNKFEEMYPGTKHAIVSSFLETLPLLKEKYKAQGTLKKCKRCGEPCSQDVCQTCVVLEQIKAL